MRVYIASGLERASEVMRLRDMLLYAGHEITYDWTAHGSVQADGPERIAEVAAAEMAGVIDADVLVALLPGGRGTHTEIGIALGFGVPVILHGVDYYTEECAFYRSAGVLDRLLVATEYGAIVAALSAWERSVEPMRPRESSEASPSSVWRGGRWVPSPAYYVLVPECMRGAP